MNPLFRDIPTSVFERMSLAARELGAVNLGQGFPDFGWPEDVVAKAAELLTGAASQYPPMRGLPELRAAVADHYSQHQGIAYAPDEITVTSGATEALASALLALIEPGDEVLLFQPLYDAYVPMVRRGGGVPRYVALRPPEWRITREAIEAALTPRTRLVVFNNPHNPTGRAFSQDELTALAEVCVARDLIVLSDEVWEHVMPGGAAHLPLASLPGMSDRTVKVGSAGKIFSLTGWKVGWIAAPAALGDPITKAHQFVTFTTPPNLQAAVAYGLGKDEAYYRDMRAAFAVARDRLADGLADAGYVVLPGEGSYFLCVDLTASGIAADDLTFCERAVREAGIAAIPLTAFFEETPVTNVIRLCFAKKQETIDEGLKRLAAARSLFA
ncbi:aminotransferase [Allosphingosinicella indica]|uniref:aspartate transaminase n=1 Tax=Allosphingosinicella indica TaxID=941907 RepID=A0A1X7FZB2_9SPHN|nr:aminotransferase [Allosphingosinicella indica]SMF61432.1 Aspartate/methionine/tyrosine aminotransferase [Allosphingosinicella indica]